MAPGRSHCVDEAVATWRRDFDEIDAIRPDDVHELCEHFRDIVSARLEDGDALAAAVSVARSQVGQPTVLAQEMSQAHRPPRFYRRWCVALVGYAIAHTTLILIRVMGLSLSAYRTDMPAPARAGDALQYSVVSVLVGVLLIWSITRRFDLLSAGRRMIRARSVLGSIGPIVSLGVVLLFGSIFADYWQWLLRAGAQTPSHSWGGVPWALLIGIGTPVLALTGATILHRWHPALHHEFS